jgi:hypothetical protein
VITTSASSLPAPALSALNKDYENQLDRISSALNGLSTASGSIAVRKFGGLAAFAEQMADIERQEAS